MESSPPTIGQASQLVHPEIYIGKVKLQPDFVDKIAGAFLQSSRKTLHFVRPTRQNGEIIIRPTKEVVDNGSKKWYSTAVGYFLGKRPYFPQLKNFARTNWKGLQHVSVSTSGFFFFRFHSRLAMEDVIEGGPWLYQGLSTVASGVGTPLYTDGITKDCSRLDFTRVCVMLNFDSELPKHLVVISPVLRNATCPAVFKRNIAPPISIFVKKQSPQQDSVWTEQNTRSETSNSAATPVRITSGSSSINKGKDIILYNSYSALDTSLIEDAECFVNTDNQPQGPNECSPLMDVHDQGSFVECRIWLAWNSLEVGVEILDVGIQFIHCRAFNKRMHTRCLISVLYGDYDIIPRREFWSALRNLSTGILAEPWLVLGDFNAVIDESEVCGQAADTSASMVEFRNCLRDTGLVSLPFTGCPFTWHNCSEEPRSLWKRLDRMLVNEAWLDIWPSSSTSPRYQAPQTILHFSPA
ncbi:hypothetical protein Sango_3115100 [Sesamum angolense]|uniref:DUF4283 domain-containing protein n=1 Tax=Sesamum angolense TaxID=2727404 RepID=A0AAE1T8X4_9LAMI|nr:hypothetical protein Sango_3115100 [Sesamum angolense]